MAFGDVKDFDGVSASALSSTNSLSLNGFTADVGDLVYALFVEENSLTVTAVTDNLGNTYTALNAGTDAGGVTARAFYSRVTHSGVLATVTFAATSSSNNNVRIAVLFEGPITVIDKNLTNITSDVTSPFSCPPTGVLAQSNEIIVAWGAADYSTTWFASSPMVIITNQSISTTAKGVIASRVPTNTLTTTPAFTASINPAQAILGTSTFKAAPAPQIITVTNAGVTLTGKIVNAIEPVTVAKASVTLTGKTVTVRDTITEKIVVTQASVTLAGKTVTVRDGELVPVAKATVTLVGKTVSLVNTNPSLSVVAVDKADLILAGKQVTLPDILIVSQATLAIVGKAVVIRGTIPISRSPVTFTGRTVTSEMSVFQNIPKYIIRGRGSRYGLWTQGNGGTIKGRGSRAFLVMQ